ncbi:MAG: hypothetical protein AAF591_14020 [Verrucomicrobiota bacterium]
MAETDRHWELKRAALKWAQFVGGYRFAGVEVRVPRSRYRADVAASMMLDPDGARSAARGGEGVEADGGDGESSEIEVPSDEGLGQSALFECKQARGDFLKDSGEEAASLEELAGLRERRRNLERQLGVHYPHLRKGETLFPEFDGIYGEELPHEGYGKLMREIGKLESRVFGRTKFAKLRRWRSAHALYLVTWPGVVRGEHEVPLGWGWLEAEEGAVEAGEGEEEVDVEEEGVRPVMGLVLRKKPMRMGCDVGTGLRWLERLAAGGTRRVNLEMGVTVGPLTR